MSIRLVQLTHRPSQGRGVAVVEGDVLCLLRGSSSVRDLASQAIAKQRPVADLLGPVAVRIHYDEVYSGTSNWALLPPFDHPTPEKCFITGTGLTHKASAENRQSMHGDP